VDVLVRDSIDVGRCGLLDAGAVAVGIGSAIVRMSSDERRTFVAALAAH